MVKAMWVAYFFDHVEVKGVKSRTHGVDVYAVKCVDLMRIP
ncbi:13024_t:CDS:2 [Funneliformis geosporum]|uniref:13024_t:CDS:1 n=1 Tax=Funneliformis geosporum TaxID=1117311 RepID=A0A9W4SB12_9GLOM|nr:13024_t:CDS:2 [Funneliformis geosporum]